MDEQPKCCGTCAWFEPALKDIGDCKYPIPDWVWGESNTVFSDDGEDCPCHKPKETSDG